MGFSAFSPEIVSLIEKGIISNADELNKWKARLAKKHGLAEFPSNTEIMGSGIRLSKKALALLCRKPVRSMSGITVVAAMVPPHECPGKCTYCPSSLVDSRTPKSYTGREPATMRAIQSNFDPALQVKDRLRQLQETGHSTSKVEFIVMGGTFFSQSEKFREKFMLGALNAFTGKNSKSVGSARLAAEKSATRITGMAFETRPDFCSKKDVGEMLSYGGTRCELGVQILDDAVYKKVHRGHTVGNVADATKNLKDAGFKVLYHTMPGLPFTSPEGDLDSFKEMFSSESFKPDMLKIYPCLVVKGTKLHEDFLEGKFSPITEKEAVKLIIKVKKTLPRWVRIMRVQRDIPSPLVEAGIKHSNLRQIVEKEMKRRGIECNCIRCREAVLQKYKGGVSPSPSEAVLFREDYRASAGTEVFLSLEDRKREALFGYCRLRIPEGSYRKEIGSKGAIVRELRIFGEPLLLGKRKQEALQHKGLGAKLFNEAEKIASEEFERKKLAVIAGLGAREYYREKLGCKNDGFYVSKRI
ncbi:MAG: tRNA uridine(34) 5-carboxymethylaminomethyl modification radical SAM/GNAT enzyme Elp3 [Candidatus Diapherotrites archaeon]|nr:tRNA uridine(34) 5-carboxymethylaminomethyl modification radical SAM/GNAT enzyme Elp3 [Candidatus Diapherotrites archaeon]